MQQILDIDWHLSRHFIFQDLEKMHAAWWLPQLHKTGHLPRCHKCELHVFECTSYKVPYPKFCWNCVITNYTRYMMVWIFRFFFFFWYTRIPLVSLRYLTLHWWIRVTVTSAFDHVDSCNQNVKSASKNTVIFWCSPVFTWEVILNLFLYDLGRKQEITTTRWLLYKVISARWLR